MTITFNNPSELKATLDSLKPAPSVESIVINGGKSPETLQLLQNYTASRSLSEPDQGISDAFNKGVLLASGLGIAFLNSGDVLVEADYYQKALKILESDHSIDFIFADLYFDDPIAGQIIFRSKEYPKEQIGKGMPFPHPTLVVRKSVFDQIGLFNLDYKVGMDYEWTVRLLKQNFTGKHLSVIPVKMDGHGISNHSELKGILECKKALEDQALFQGKTKKDFNRRYLNFRIRTFVKSVFGNKVLKLLKRLNQS